MKTALAALGLVWTAALGAGCSDQATGTPKAQPAPAAVPVGVATAVQRDVPVQVIALGNVQAYTTVGVKSQVAGQLMRVHFTEGQEVKRDQLLFTIDPRPFEAALHQARANVGKDTAQLRQMEAALAQRQAEITQAQANLERDQAQMENARVQEARYKYLVQKDLVAREQYDQYRTNLVALTATVAASRRGERRYPRAARRRSRIPGGITANEAAVDAAGCSSPTRPSGRRWRVAPATSSSSPATSSRPTRTRPSS
jgi:multidrug efflux system membrane fusion protein